MDAHAVTVESLRESPTQSVEVAAKALGVSRAYAYQLARTGDLPTIKVGSRIRVPTAALLRLLSVE